MITTLHHGQIIEKTIRRNGYSITDIARLTQVNRRSVYNWFNQKKLKPEIIHRIGDSIQYDFSSVIPELKAEYLHFEEPAGALRIQNHSVQVSNEEQQSIEYWKNKYISLLEAYHTALQSKTKVLV